MIINEKGKKMGIKYSPNLNALAINAKEFYENETLEGRATEGERMAAEVVENPRKFYKKGVSLYK